MVSNLNALKKSRPHNLFSPEVLCVKTYHCALTLRGKHHDHVHSLLSKLVCRPAKALEMV